MAFPRLACLLLLSLCARPALAEKVLLAALQGDGAASTEVVTAHASFVRHAQALSTYEVIDTPPLSIACDAACALVAAKKHGADAVAVGTLTVRPGTVHIDLSLIDVATRVERHRAAVSVRGNDVAYAMRSATTQLLAPHRYLGGLVVNFDKVGAAVLVDSIAVTHTPMLAAIELPPGRHEVEVNFPNLKRFRRFVDIDFENTTRLPLNEQSGAIVEQVAADTTVVSTEVASAPPSSGPPALLWAGVSLGSLGVASLLAGGALVAVQLNLKQTWHNGDASDETVRNADALYPWGNAALAVGAGAVVVGAAVSLVALLFFGPSDDAQPEGAASDARPQQPSP